LEITMPTTICARRPCRVALYTRTRDLHASSSIGQEIRLRQFLLSQPDWNPVAEHADYGSDARRTGPALRRVVADARTGQFDLLLVARPDVLGRNLTQVTAVLADLDRAGVAIATSDGAVNTTRPADRLLLAVLTAVAEYKAARQYALDRVERTRRRRRRARRAACRRLYERG
jgi:site-specific DNA recombinase